MVHIWERIRRPIYNDRAREEYVAKRGDSGPTEVECRVELHSVKLTKKNCSGDQLWPCNTRLSCADSSELEHQ